LKEAAGAVGLSRPPPSEPNPAFAAAVKLLSVKRLTKVQLAQKLRDRAYAGDAIEKAVAECERRKFVDDRTYAQLYVKGVLERKAIGRLRLMQDLLGRGIDADLVREVLDDTDENEDERIDRALANLEATRPQDGYGQLGRRLERLGFGAPSIARALRRRAQSRGPLPGPDEFEERS
jgi:SOS response regulatory protein OraA/RecX